ncbi:ABC1 kinase family protein [Desulfocurvibacter africanus]|uniref:ABC-1 domain-containing protein n=1 Tax=Desulfocurvibacter africanus subsp. africanus str. Walvis Bay TaxID=690850 RepID=F3YUE7_DESAF|nr:AarF/UbiB family protein [Desulfocurvibacter africanus]EGJ48829.1 ABC-1 domain-containing protein [Desulfocurvibacter africanus subsp. africanus str. Walvis Bay]
MQLNRGILPHPLRTAGRLRDVVGILVKYGFGHVVEALHLPGRELVRRMTHVEPGISVWKRIRLAIEELGPTYIKFGQVLSLRPDLVPLPLAKELGNLQERVRPESFENIRAVAEESLGKPLGECFSEFAREPMATGSLAQVHKAVPHCSSQIVAVKILRPDIRETVASDLDLLANMANMANQHVESLRSFDLPSVVRELGKMLAREMNFLNEAQNMAIFRRNFAEDPGVYCPAVLPELTTAEVLTMELVTGVRITEYVGSAEERDRLAHIGMESALRQILEFGMFHADPHPGNLRIVERPDGQGHALAFLDWGMSGRLTERQRGVLFDFFMALSRRQSRTLVRALRDMSMSAPPLLDDTGLEAELLYLLDRLHDPAGQGELVSGPLIDMVNLCREYGLRLRPDYVYTTRALVASEAAGRIISPDFDVMGELQPMARRYLRKRIGKLFSENAIIDGAEDLFGFLRSLPERVGFFFRLVEAGKLGIEFSHKNLESFEKTLSDVGKRLATALITAALIIGSSLVVAADAGPHWRGQPVLGLVGYILSGVFGAWLVWSMVFHKK